MQALAYEGLPLNQKEELRIAKLNQKKTATARQKNPYDVNEMIKNCLLYTSPSPRDRQKSRMPSSA